MVSDWSSNYWWELNCTERWGWLTCAKEKEGGLWKHETLPGYLPLIEKPVSQDVMLNAQVVAVLNAVTQSRSLLLQALVLVSSSGILLMIKASRRSAWGF